MHLPWRPSISAFSFLLFAFSSVPTWTRLEMFWDAGRDPSPPQADGAYVQAFLCGSLHHFISAFYFLLFLPRPLSVFLAQAEGLPSYQPKATPWVHGSFRHRRPPACFISLPLGDFNFLPLDFNFSSPLSTFSFLISVYQRLLAQISVPHFLFCIIAFNFPLSAFLHQAEGLPS